MALIVFLSHIGSFVPADAATVGLTDRLNVLDSFTLLESLFKGISVLAKISRTITGSFVQWEASS